MSSSPSDPAASPTTAATQSTAPLAPTKPAQRVPLFTAEAWAPLKVDLFRSLWIATSIAQIGTWTREAAGPTLMESLTHTRPDKAEWVARVLVFSNLPICLFSVFAGVLADVLDRRRLLIVTQVWMVVVSALLGVLTYAGWIHPVSLLLFTFLLGLGTAAFGPALQAVLPELVPKQHFALAINMNSIALNVARAVGPALFIVVVTFVPGDHGAGLSFLLSALSFIGAVWVLVRWKRPPQRAAVAGEGVWNGIRAGFRYNVHSPANRAILLRVAAFIIPAVVIWSQVPIIATEQLHAAASRQEAQRVAALLFAFVGTGAILGVLLMPGLHARYSIDPVVNVCTACFAAGLIALSFVHSLWLAALILIFLGVNWVIIPTNFNTATQKSVPPWVKGRAISFYLTVLFGSFTVGGALWGRVTTASSIGTSLMVGGVAMGAMLALAYWFPLTLNEGLNLAPLGEAGATFFPDLAPPPDPAAGPNLTPANGDGGRAFASPSASAGPLDVTVEYDVEAARVEEFLAAMPRVAQVRRRNGATHWRLRAVSEADGASPAGVVRYAERFRYQSPAEYARQPARMTGADAEVLRRAQSFVAGGNVRAAVGPADLSETPGLRATAGSWAAGRLAVCFDRALCEAEVAVDRFVALAERERLARRG